MSNPFHPLVSIVIPVYNGSNFVREAIDSALAQTYDNVEIIVVNDGSTDEGKTREIALSYGDKIRYFEKPNGGVSSALNMGISNMQGQYFSWLSHDDMYAPDKIKNQVELLAGFEERNVLALCKTRQIDKDGNFMKKSFGERLKKGEQVDSYGALSATLKQGCLSGCALLVPKTAFDKCGGFDESLRYCQDLKMWLSIFLAGFTLVYDDKPDCLSRVHDNQLTQKGVDIYHKDCIAICEQLLPSLVAFTDKKRRCVYDYALYSAKYNTPEVWKACLKQKGATTFGERARVRCMALYGKVRPTIRKVYFALFKKVKTK